MSSINWTHQKVPVWLLNQLNNNSTDWVWLSSIDFLLSFVRLAMLGIEYEDQHNLSACCENNLFKEKQIYEFPD